MSLAKILLGTVYVLVAMFVSLLSQVPLAAQDLVISEFMAQNDSFLEDDDLEFSDWIEVYNNSGSALDLDGWYLSDNESELTKWRFPAVSLEAAEFLIVFATGNDRVDPAEALHTNFRLTSDGEFLGVIRPDGVTVEMAFSPVYPFQFPDLSYGLKQEQSTSVLIDEGASLRALVPTSGTLGSTWRQPAFNDAAWIGGTTGLGFDLGSDYDALIGTDVVGPMHGNNATVYSRIEFEASQTATLDKLLLNMKYDDGFVAYLNGTEVARRNAPGSLSWNSAATGDHGQPQVGSMSQDYGGGGTSSVLTAHGNNFPPRVLSGGPNGSYLELTRDDTGSLVNTVGFAKAFGLAESIHAEFDFRMPVEAGHTGCCGERADGFGFALIDTDVYGNSGPGPSVGNIIWERPAFPNVFSVGFDIFNGQGTENTVNINWNGVEVSARLVGEFNLNNGVFNRCEIDIVRDGNASLVTVRLIPDSLVTPDAPVTIVDGLRIAGMTPFENRVAFGARTGGAFVKVDIDNIQVDYSTSATQDLEFEEIDISPQVGLLIDGTNVLAIQGLNVAPSDPDFIIVPQLVGVATGGINLGVLEYFPDPSPGAFNTEGVAGFALRPDFSRDAGAFVSNFNLTLSNLLGGVEIRYTTNRSEPTESSSLYTGPISISATTVVKAKAFKDGLLPSPTVSNTYVKIASNIQNVSSNLPIVIIETFSQGVGDSSQTSVYSVFIDVEENGRSRILGTPNFQGNAGMKQRGSSSAGFPKKQWSFETWDSLGDDKNTEILGFSPESDYILYAPYSDKALMRNVLTYAWSNMVGQWAVRTQFVELYYNTNGGSLSSSDYYGVYVFMEKIKRDESRVDIKKLVPTMTTAPEITGGYIIKKDRLDPGDSGFLTSRGQRLAFVEPKEREIPSAQSSWIRNYMNSFESALYGANFANPATGYAAYIDVDSFIDHHIITELLKNIDGYRLSTFYYKDRGGKLVMGPIWDFNLSLGNANYLQGWLPQGWYYPQINSDQYPYFPRLFQDPEFQQRYIDRWAELRQDEFVTNDMLADIDATAAYINEAQSRNFQRWNILGSYVWPNWYIADSWPEELTWMKNWLRSRLAWFDGNYLRTPQLNQDGGLIEPGFELTMSAPTGTVYYTLDGSDPRMAGGGISPLAVPFGSAASETLVSSAVSEVRVLVPDSDIGQGWTDQSFGDVLWTRGVNGIGVGYERGSGYESHIDVDVAADMDGGNPSVYLRIAFDAQDVEGISSLVLRMKYDDGFIAYINGTEVASANAPASPAWNSQATSLHDDGEAVVFQTYDISGFVDQIVNGANVLAIHGLNESPGSSDMLVEPELLASSAFEGESLVLNEPTQVIARTWNNSNIWSGKADFVFVTESDLPLRITEIHYHPQDLPAESPYNGGALEFIELQNIGPVPVDLSGVRFTNGIEFDFTTGAVDRLNAGEFLVVVRNQDAFEWFYGSEGILVAGEYTNNLDNGGETIELLDGTGEGILQFRYEDEWYPTTDGAGPSLVIRDVGADRATWALAASWRAGEVVDGTPGTGDVPPPPRGFQFPGNVNQDAVLDMSDGISLLLHLFGGVAMDLPCEGAIDEGGNLFVLDVNDDAGVDLSDATYILNYLFLDGPGPVQGTDCVRLNFCADACD